MDKNVLPPPPLVGRTAAQEQQEQQAPQAPPRQVSFLPASSSRQRSYSNDQLQQQQHSPQGTRAPIARNDSAYDSSAAPSPFMPRPSAPTNATQHAQFQPSPRAAHQLSRMTAPHHIETARQRITSRGPSPLTTPVQPVDEYGIPLANMSAVAVAPPYPIAESMPYPVAESMSFPSSAVGSRVMSAQSSMYGMPPAGSNIQMVQQPDGSVLMLAPTMTIAQPVRRKTVKDLKLTGGNLVINCPVPDRLLNNVPLTNAEEFTTMRYTAVTCDPDEFVAKKYMLRQAMSGRQTELFIVMTMYNEDDELFIRSMTSVMKNIAYLCSRDRSRTWGPRGWEKVVVCIVSDGRSKIHPRVLQVLGLMGCYQEGVAQTEVNGNKTQAHLYEHTTQVCVDSDLRLRGADKGFVPVQILFCLKEQNKKKLNSHRWFFNAFAPLLQPNVCVLIDVGTKPTTNSIYHLWKAFDGNPSLGGACGEIAADLGKGCNKVLLNPLVAAQNFEYKMSNVLDKPLESVFGYISVLPGAFSAYRYEALRNTAPGIGPLASYFEGEKLHDGASDIFKANMYLAEDRILCFELVAKKNSDWVLKYVKAAKAETDVPEGVAEFISQRRRWLNGSFFAAIYALAHWYRIWRTEHSLAQKLWFQVQLIYNALQMFFTWFSLANFYLSFFFLSQNIIGDNDPFVVNGSPVGDWVFQFFRQMYILAIVTIFISSLGNRPQGSKSIYVFCMILFAFIMILMLFLSGWTVVTTVKAELGGVMAAEPGASQASAFWQALVSSAAFRDIFLTLVMTYGLFWLASLLHAEPFHMVTSFVQYLLFLPSFTNILMVYAFSNTHDISWGTKGDNKAPDLGAAKPAQKPEHVDVELPFDPENLTDKTQLNTIYDSWLSSLPSRPAPEPPKRDLKTKLEDWYRNFRTRMLLFWMFSNALLISAMTHPRIVALLGGTGAGSNVYLAFIFYSVLGLTVIRFVGSMIYLMGHYRRRLFGCC